MIESKPDHFLDDLRLNNPWPELRRYIFSLSILISFFGVCSCLPFVYLLLLLSLVHINLSCSFTTLCFYLCTPECTLSYIGEILIVYQP